MLQVFRAPKLRLNLAGWSTGQPLGGSLSDTDHEGCGPRKVALDKGKHPKAWAKGFKEGLESAFTGIYLRDEFLPSNAVHV